MTLLQEYDSINYFKYITHLHVIIQVFFCDYLISMYVYPVSISSNNLFTQNSILFSWFKSKYFSTQLICFGNSLGN